VGWLSIVFALKVDDEEDEEKMSFHDNSRCRAMEADH
jgi:hypothetical protein